MLKEALQKCMEISQVSETIGREELENCAAEVENYYTQSMVNLQVEVERCSCFWLTDRSPTRKFRER